MRFVEVVEPSHCMNETLSKRMVPVRCLPLTVGSSEALQFTSLRGHRILRNPCLQYPRRPIGETAAASVIRDRTDLTLIQDWAETAAGSNWKLVLGILSYHEVQGNAPESPADFRT